MGGDLNLKKSWHPGLMKNQERVWLEEKRALDERKQIAQLRREREEERQMEEIQRLQEASGKTKLQTRVDWMYQAPSSATGHYSEEMEGYLLGKRRIDGVLLKNDPDTKKLEKGSEVVGSGAAAGPSVVSARDTMSKVMADPLLEVKKREQAAYDAMVKEAIRRKEREQKRAGSDRGKERDRGERDHRHRTYESKRRRYSDDASDERRDRHHRRSSPRRHRSRSPPSPGRSSRRHRSDRERDRRDDKYRADDRDRRSDKHRSRRDDRDRDTDRRDHLDKRDSYSSRHRDREDRRDRDLSPRRYSRSPSPDSGPKERPAADEKRRRDFPRREYNNRRDFGEAQGPPSTRTPAIKPDPKELEEERRRKLAEMQSSASDMETERRRRLAELSIKEEQQREADDRLRSDRGRFMSDVNKRVQEDTLDERIRRSRGGLAKMDED